MDKFSNEEVTTGYNDLKQVEVSIQSAQKMIGTATMSMSPQQLEEATNALMMQKHSFNLPKLMAQE